MKSHETYPSPVIYKDILIYVMVYVENIYKTSYWKGWRHVDKHFHAVRIPELSVKATFHISAASTTKTKLIWSVYSEDHSKVRGDSAAPSYLLSPSKENRAGHWNVGVEVHLLLLGSSDYRNGPWYSTKRNCVHPITLWILVFLPLSFIYPPSRLITFHSNLIIS
jgi:hypothetical protein